MKNLRILILDHEAGIRKEVAEFLQSKDFIVYEAANLADAFHVLEYNPIDIAILDIHLPHLSDVQVVKKFKRTYPTLEVILICDDRDMDSEIESFPSGATGFLKKPFRLREILAAIEKSGKCVHQALDWKMEKYEISFSHEF